MFALAELTSSLSTKHKRRVMCVAWCGEYIASGDDRGKVLIHAVTQGELLKTLRGHENEVCCLCFGNDRQLLASGSADKTVILWHVETFKSAGEHCQCDYLRGHKHGVTCVSFNPAGTICCSGGRDGSVMLWSTTSLKCIIPELKHDGVTSVAFSPSGSLLAVACKDGGITLWKIDEHQGVVARECVLHNYQEEGGEVRSVECVAFSGDGKSLICGMGSRECNLVVWDIAADTHDGHEVTVVDGHSNWVVSVAVSPDGSTVATASDDCSILVWELHKQRGEGTSLHKAALGCRALQGHDHYVTDVAFSSDGCTLVSSSSDTTVKLWDVRTGESLELVSKVQEELGLLFSLAAFGEDSRKGGGTQRRTSYVMMLAGVPDIVRLILTMYERKAT